MVLETDPDSEVLFIIWPFYVALVFSPLHCHRPSSEDHFEALLSLFFSDTPHILLLFCFAVPLSFSFSLLHVLLLSSYDCCIHGLSLRFVNTASQKLQGKERPCK